MIDLLESLLIGLVSVIIWLLSLPIAVISILIQNGNNIAYNWMVRVNNYLNKNKED